QAEDGIRDRTVTGVQTCALPISPNLLFQEYVPGGVDWMFNGYFDEASRCLFAASGFKVRQYPVGTGPTSLGECRRNDGVHACARSEERRVGKEWRSRVERGPWKE